MPRIYVHTDLKFSDDPEQNAELKAEYFWECRIQGIDPFGEWVDTEDYEDEEADYDDEEDSDEEDGGEDGSCDPKPA